MYCISSRLHDASHNEPFESRDKAEDILNRGGEIYAVNKYGTEELVNSVKELKEIEEEAGPFRGFIMGDRQPKQPIHYLSLSPGLKDVALKKGFPLFSAGYSFSPIEHNPFVLTPTDHDPFEEKKK